MSSLITVSTNSNDSLTIFLDALAAGSSLPREVIVIDLKGTAEIRKAYNFIIKIQPLNNFTDAFPISAALNLGARKAWEDQLIFLDVDCIPSSTFIQKMEDHLQCASGLIMGEPRVLKAPATGTNTEVDLFANSTYTPQRPELKKELTFCFNPALFWGGGYGITKKEFEAVGGFDENYKAGSTLPYHDFVYKLQQEKKDFYLSRNTFYQSYSKHSKQLTRPIKDFNNLVTDSNYFFKKWGEWSVPDLLGEYANKGFIKWMEQQVTDIEILKFPVSDESDALTLTVATA